MKADYIFTEPTQPPLRAAIVRTRMPSKPAFPLSCLDIIKARETPLLRIYVRPYPFAGRYMIHDHRLLWTLDRTCRVNIVRTDGQIGYRKTSVRIGYRQS